MQYCQRLGMGLVAEVGSCGFIRAIGEIFVVMEYLGCGGGYTDLLMLKYTYIHTRECKENCAL